MSEDLPKGWALTSISSVCSKPQYGWTTSAKKSAFGLKLLRTTDISGGAIDWGSVPVCKANPSNPTKYLLQPGDIVVSRAGSVGVSQIVRDCPPAVFASYLIRLRPLGEISADFISLFLNSPSFWTAIAEEAAGIAIQNVNATKLAALKVPLPPLAEQNRIVVAVKALMARMDGARRRLARLMATLRQFRQAVLAAACDGRLTEDWRRCQSVGDRPGLAVDGLPGWRRLPIADVASKEPRSIQSGPFGSNLLHSEFSDKGRLVIGIDNVGDGRFLSGKGHRITAEKFRLLEKYRARPADVVVTVMATVGRCCIIPEDIEPAIISKHVYRVTANRAVMLPEFLLTVLRGDTTVRAQVQDQIHGQTRPGINGQILKSLVVPVPPIEEQAEAVRRVASLLALADAVDRRAQAATAHADRLRQALLAKAFRGELVPTEAELARREGRSYEPAEALLQRMARTP